MKVSRYLYSALLVALLLPVTGCGNDSGNNSGTEVVVPAKADAFIAGVQTLVAITQEDTEPSGLDALVATAPEDTEPVNL